jgi:ADP-heptose:LPS heptosyltransferase
MHIAAAVGTPVVAIFGPTRPVRTGPYGSGHVVLQSGLPCVNCLKKRCNDLKCMEAITVDDVLTAVKGILKNKK